MSVVRLHAIMYVHLWIYMRYSLKKLHHPIALVLAPALRVTVALALSLALALSPYHKGQALALTIRVQLSDRNNTSVHCW